jgi:hypothetical protein
MRRRALALGVLAAAATGVALATGGAAVKPPPIVACEGAAAIDFGCFERRYIGFVRAAGAAPALRDLARQRARNGYVRAACHQLTHRVGRAAGATAGMRAFDDGDPLCSSGYYHGVIEAVMARIGRQHVLAQATSVCAQLRERQRRSADHYNCAHGMGHGFMGSFSSDVFASLRGCDALLDGWERRHCYGGVFMENLSAIGHPERPPTALRPRDPLYPCTAVARRYREPCFDKQTTYALYVTDSDFAQVFRLCSRIERAFRGACYRGLGGDIAVGAAKHLFDERARALSRRRLCLLGADRDARRECVVGVVRVTLRDLAGGAAQTAAFCRTLGAGALHRVCVRARDEGYRQLPLQPDARLPTAVSG